MTIYLNVTGIFIVYNLIMRAHEWKWIWACLLVDLVLNIYFGEWE